MDTRFTIDGSEALEHRLAETCSRVACSVAGALPPARLEALVLGGGYGRGEGGVLRTAERDLPYNDLEFYVFLRGSRIVNERKFGATLRDLGEEFSVKAGLHVEFKLESAIRFRRVPVSMFSYDLVAGHKVILGDADIFRGCGHHLRPENIPPSEATRLLFNRCSGLLLARELLIQDRQIPEDSDFVGRNIAKAQLALGDVVLTILGQYHWSCLERHRRLLQITSVPDLACFDELRTQHSAGVDFKVHPRRPTEPVASMATQLSHITALALNAWLWLERRRLNQGFASAADYTLDSAGKCHGSSAWRNYVLNLRSFGLGAALDPMARRYPRERLLNALPLLLWGEDGEHPPQVTRHLQRQLRIRSSNWSDMVAAYKRIWPNYG